MKGVLNIMVHYGNLGISVYRQYCNLVPTYSRMSSSDSLTVTGDLNITLSDIDKLPDEVYVLGNMIIDGCDSIKELPKKLVVCGNLIICRSAIVKINSGIHVSGNIYIDDCNELTDIVFPITGSMSDNIIIGCDKLTHIEGEYIEGDLRVVNCPAFQGFSTDSVTVYGSLKLIDCDSMTRVANTLIVRNGLGIHRCMNLQEIATSPVIARCLKVRDCQNLTAIDIDGDRPVFVQRVVDIRHCKSLHSITGALYVCEPGRKLKLVNLPALKTIPDIIYADKVHIESCDALETIPNIETKSLAMTNEMFEANRAVIKCDSITFIENIPYDKLDLDKYDDFEE